MLANIEKVINDRSFIEEQRVEFKKAWDGKDVLHTICAFANDLQNYGGGYIFIGIEERNGLPVRPPIGLQKNQIDAYQKKLNELCNKLYPFYFPIIYPYTLDDKTILVIEVRGGDDRPYKAPKDLSKSSIKFPYIRRGTSTAKANKTEERQLLELSQNTPFDEKINYRSNLNDIDIFKVKEFLREIGSPLLEQSNTLLDFELYAKMQLLKGPDEDIRPRNIAILFFGKLPYNFYRGILTSIIKFGDNEGTNIIFTKDYKSALYTQIRLVLSFLQEEVIKTRVIKKDEILEAKTIFNYPLLVLREAVINAFYHRGYDIESPTEIVIYPNKIVVVSYPAALPPVNSFMLEQEKILPRQYRNRTLGEFLRELGLSELRATGISTMRKKLRENGSPNLVFNTDDETYFSVQIPIHPDFEDRQSKTVNEDYILLNSLEQRIIEFCNSSRTKKEIITHLSSNISKEKINNTINILMKNQLLEKREAKILGITISSFYYSTEKGKFSLKNSF